MTGFINFYLNVNKCFVSEFTFKSEIALWLSPNGKKIAFVTFNDTLVSNMSIPWYEEQGNRWHRYPLNFDIHYPKVICQDNTHSSSSILQLNLLNRY